MRFIILIGLFFGGLFFGCLTSVSFAEDIETNLPSTGFTVEDGYAAHEAGDYNQARQIIETLAAQGNAHAMNAIGRFYDHGKVYPKNEKLECEWYEKSAYAGYVPANYNMTYCYEDIDGNITNTSAWEYWMTRAADNGYKPAQTVLMAHLIIKDREKAIFWAKKAAAQGSAAARVSLWQINEDQEIEPVSISEIACVFIFIDLLRNHNVFCD